MPETSRLAFCFNTDFRWAILMGLWKIPKCPSSLSTVALGNSSAGDYLGGGGAEVDPDLHAQPIGLTPVAVEGGRLTHAVRWWVLS